MREPLPADIAAAFERAKDQLALSFGRELYLSETSSTNDVAAHLAISGAPEGTTVISGAQKTGRGRQGRSWYSPPEAGLYVSILCRSCPMSRMMLLTLIGGVAVAEGIRRSTGLPVLLKWPNDVVVEGSVPMYSNRRWRKVAGVLTEASSHGRSINYVILGFGINLRAMAFPESLAKTATSVEIELGRSVDRSAVLVEVLTVMSQCYADLLEGEIDMIIDRWRRLSPSCLGARVKFNSSNGCREGVTEGVDQQGALLVRVDSLIEQVTSGEIKWL